MPLCIRSAAGCLSVSLCIQPVDGTWGCLWSLRVHPGIATQPCYAVQLVCVPLCKGKCSCLAVGFPASMVTLWVGCRPKGQWDAPDQFERWDGVILRLSLALSTAACPWTSNSAVCFSSEQKFAAFRPCLWWPFRGEDQLYPAFLTVLGPPGWLKLVSLAAPQPAIWLILKCVACVFSFPWVKFALFPGKTWWLLVGWYGSGEGCSQPPTLPHPAWHAEGVAQLTMRKCLSHASCAALLLCVYTWALPCC